MAFVIVVVFALGLVLGLTRVASPDLMRPLSGGLMIVVGALFLFASSRDPEPATVPQGRHFLAPLAFIVLGAASFVPLPASFLVQMVAVGIIFTAIVLRRRERAPERDSI